LVDGDTGARRIRDTAAIDLASAWALRARLVLGVVKIDADPNEIAAVPARLVQPG
jgi:hypothetical protein